MSTGGLKVADGGEGAGDRRWANAPPTLWPDEITRIASRQWVHLGSRLFSYLGQRSTPELPSYQSSFIRADQLCQ